MAAQFLESPVLDLRARVCLELVRSPPGLAAPVAKACNPGLSDRSDARASAAGAVGEIGGTDGGGGAS